jgi:hypothetical protein
MFSQSSLIFSQDSVMLAAWPRGTGGIFFPDGRNTAFKPTFEESNKRHSIGRVGVQEPL